jgi:hypothetical protein
MGAQEQREENIPLSHLSFEHSHALLTESFEHLKAEHRVDI